VSAGTVLVVGVLGGLGAVARSLVGGAVTARLGTGFPVGTLVVNLTGAFALGVLVGAALDDGTARALGTGFLGAYTTFSTWTLESRRLADEGRTAATVANVAGSLVAGVLLAWLGRELGAAL
jgi:CrcB protein